MKHKLIALFTLSFVSSALASSPLTFSFENFVNALLEREDVELTCPNSNGTIYSTVNNETFIVECYLDRPGAIGNPQTAGLGECIDSCANTTGCVDVSWLYQSVGSGVCYMKAEILNGTSNANVWGARWANTTYLTTVSPQATRPPYVGATASVIRPIALSTFTDVPYTLIEDMQPADFFDHFRFNPDYDPTLGTVEYINRQVALKKGMFDTFDDHVMWNVDNTTVIEPGIGVNRRSIRLVSHNNYTHGLFVLDLNHMAFGCGTWPAFWTVGDNWPYNGEIDIIEGVNRNLYNSISLHTAGDTCLVSGIGTMANETFNDNKCSWMGGDYVGCGFTDMDMQSYGSGLNSIGGGVVVMEWTSNWIRTWFFNRTTVPPSITAGQPNSTLFGPPRSNFEFVVTNTSEECTMDQRFNNHQIIFDTTMCGAWAGPAFGFGDGCPVEDPTNHWTSCSNYILRYPGNLTEAYWDVNSIKVYQQVGTQGTKHNLAASMPEASDQDLSPDFVCPNYNYSTVSYAGLRWLLLCDYDNGSSANTTIAANLEDCIQSCAQNDQCVGLSYQPFTIPTISSVSPTSYKPTVTETASPANDAALTCPDSDGIDYVTTDGGIYNVQCYADYPGGDLANQLVDSLAGCIQLCSNTVNCVGASFLVSGGPLSQCYMKQTLVKKPNNNPGVYGFVQVNPKAHVSTSASTTTTLSSVNYCYLKSQLGSPASKLGMWNLQLYDTAVAATYTNPNITVATTFSSSRSSSTRSSVRLTSTFTSSGGIYPSTSTPKMSMASSTSSGSAIYVLTSLSSRSSSSSASLADLSKQSTTQTPFTSKTLSSQTQSAAFSSNPVSSSTSSSVTSILSPLPISTLTPECRSIFLDSSNNTAWRIYCNAALIGPDLLQRPSTSLIACIDLCDANQDTCLAAVFYNSTAPFTCVLIANTTNDSSTRLKRAVQALVYQTKTFVALRLVNAEVDQGPPEPFAPLGKGGSVSGSTRPSAVDSTAPVSDDSGTTTSPVPVVVTSVSAPTPTSDSDIRPGSSAASSQQMSTISAVIASSSQEASSTPTSSSSVTPMINSSSLIGTADATNAPAPSSVTQATDTDFVLGSPTESDTYSSIALPTSSSRVSSVTLTSSEYFVTTSIMPSLTDSVCIGKTLVVTTYVTATLATFKLGMEPHAKGPI